MILLRGKLSFVYCKRNPLFHTLNSFRFHTSPICQLSTADKSIPGPKQAYLACVEKREIQCDRHQLKIVEKLQKLHEDLAGYEPSPPPETGSTSGWIGRLFGGGGISESVNSGMQERKGPKGIYLWGGTGTGKTFMMDLFYHEAPVVHKRRVHFHRFMLDIHARLHDLRAHGFRGDPLPQVAQELVEEGWLLCFDEFQVTDVADAMVLKRLFEAMLGRGAVVVATSNREPRDLYKNGLQRDLFVPFIDLLEETQEVVALSTHTPDYRVLKGSVSAENVLHWPSSSPEVREHFESTWDHLTQGRVTSQTTSVRVQGGRVLALGAGRFSVSARCGRVTWEEACGKPLGAADYVALAGACRTLCLEGVPRLSLRDLNQVRRFITLVDNLYEARVRLVALLADHPRRLFRPDGEDDVEDHSDDRDDQTAEAGEAPPARHGPEGHDEVFAFDRTVSRLLEMQSQSYLNRTWSLHGPDFLAQFLSPHPAGVQGGGLDAEDAQEIWDMYDVNGSRTLDAQELTALFTDVAILHQRQHQHHHDHHHQERQQQQKDGAASWHKPVTSEHADDYTEYLLDEDSMRRIQNEVQRCLRCIDIDGNPCIFFDDFVHLVCEERLLERGQLSSNDIHSIASAV